jgi:hypothetical protein
MRSDAGRAGMEGSIVRFFPYRTAPFYIIAMDPARLLEARIHPARRQARDDMDRRPLARPGN